MEVFPNTVPKPAKIWHKKGLRYDKYGQGKSLLQRIPSGNSGLFRENFIRVCDWKNRLLPSVDAGSGARAGLPEKRKKNLFRAQEILMDGYRVSMVMDALLCQAGAGLLGTGVKAVQTPSNRHGRMQKRKGWGKTPPMNKRVPGASGGECFPSSVGMPLLWNVFSVKSEKIHFIFYLVILTRIRWLPSFFTFCRVAAPSVP